MKLFRIKTKIPKKPNKQENKQNPNQNQTATEWSQDCCSLTVGKSVLSHIMDYSLTKHSGVVTVKKQTMHSQK